MPEQKTIQRAHADKRAGKASSTQAGEFVKEEVDRVRAGKHGVKSARQAIAIGLSKARRAGVDPKAPKKGTTSETARKKAAKDNAAGKHKTAAKSNGRERVKDEARACRHHGAEAREWTRRVERGVVEAGEEFSCLPARREPFGGGEKGRSYESGALASLIDA